MLAISAVYVLECIQSSGNLLNLLIVTELAYLVLGRRLLSFLSDFGC